MKTFLLIFLLSITFYSQAQNSFQDLRNNNTNRNFFIENKGQWDPAVVMLARTGGLNLWITQSGAVYDFYRNEGVFDFSDDSEQDTANAVRKGHVINLEYLHANGEPEVIGEGKRIAYYNYFIGNNESKWAAEVPLFDNVTIKNLYEGIDVTYYYDDDFIRYDYIANPGSDLNLIRMNIDGADNIAVNENGELIITTIVGDMVFGKLLAYQNSWYGAKPITCGFTKKGTNEVGITAIDYDPGKSIIIDPLIFGTFLGGEGGDRATDINTDSYGNIICTGYTFSTDFPVTPGAYQQQYHWGHDITISKFNADCSQLIFSTYIGGGHFDKPEEADIDSEGNIYITGYTNSHDYPSTYGTINEGRLNSENILLTKLSPSGSHLAFSTFFGGSEGSSIAVDDAGYIYIAGTTDNPDFPVTENACDTTKDAWDAFISKILPDATGFVYSTFAGGAYVQKCYDMTIDEYGNCYITGSAVLGDVPPAGSLNKSLPTESDGSLWNHDLFLFILNAEGDQAINSIVIPASADDWGLDIKLDQSGNIFIAGITNSHDFPVTNGCFSSVYKHFRDVFVMKRNSTGDSLIASTFIGGWGHDTPDDIDIDPLGNIIAVVKTNSDDFPVTPMSFDETFNGEYDCAVFKMNSDLTQLLYSTYFGGYDVEVPNGVIAADETNILLTGFTTTENLLTGGTGYDSTHNGFYDIFVAEFSTEPVTAGVAVTEPNGGQSYRVNTLMTISWSFTDVRFIDIDYSTNNGAGWINIKTRLSAFDNAALWHIPSGINSEECRIRITDADHPSVYDLSDSPFTIYDPSTSADEDNQLPDEFALHQNYPNPFNPITTIQYDLPKPAEVKLTIFSAAGERITELVNEYKPAGFHSVTFDASPLSSGIYFYRINAGVNQAAGKMILLK
jgi:hypothetical protein